MCPWQFLRARWQSDPCYAFYGVDGSTCSILVYLSQIEDFCPAEPGRNHTAVPWHHKTASYTEKVFSLPSWLLKFIRSRVERMSERWIWAGRRMKTSRNHTATPQMKVLLYLGALAGSVGHRFEAMVDRGGPLGELVQWADLSACLTVLGHNLSFSTSHLIGAAPGQGSCPIQRPLTFDLIYTDYHGLAHLHRAMGLAFQHYQCRFRILDSFGTEPAFNLASYAHIGGYETLWGSWGLQPLQYMTMFPHTPDNSFLGFVSEEAAKTGMRQTRLQPGSSQKDGIAVDLEIHGTVYQPPGHTSTLPSFVKNHRLLSQENFLQLLRRAKVFVGLGFPYEGPAPVEAIALGCMFLQPRFDPPHSSLNNDFYKGKPTTRQITSQHPYAEQFIAKPYVWTVDMTNRTDIREAVKSILKTKLRYCSGQALCVTIPGSVALVLFGRLGLGCSSTAQEVNHLFPAYSPWGRLCGLQREPRLFSCAGADSAHRRLCPCRNCERSQGK
uniref:alpha-1,6-mannosyl-glycoprotein 6-beta-N-acetylglucosaminyltransferase n=1 Tax=Fundulus heteroclitus TaxID=8078 RepID=A0A3Q2SQ55_FUNHE